MDGRPGVTERDDNRVPKKCSTPSAFGANEGMVITAEAIASLCLTDCDERDPLVGLFPQEGRHIPLVVADHRDPFHRFPLFTHAPEEGRAV